MIIAANILLVTIVTVQIFTIATIEGPATRILIQGFAGTSARRTLITRGHCQNTAHAHTKAATNSLLAAKLPRADANPEP